MHSDDAALKQDYLKFEADGRKQNDNSFRVLEMNVGDMNAGGDFISQIIAMIKSFLRIFGIIV